jgi:hypothetical protein
MRRELPIGTGASALSSWAAPASTDGGVPMVIAADYPFMDVLWSMIIFFV